MTETDDTQPDSIRAQLGRLARIIARSQQFRGDTAALGRGERSALQRLNPEAPLQRHFGPLVHALMLAEVSMDRFGNDRWTRWALIAQGMAFGGHDGRTRLGSQLAAARVTELRITRFLNARNSAFRQQVSLLMRLMASREVSPNWVELGVLVLTTDEGKAEEQRLRIAQDYYKAIYRDNASTGIDE